SWLKASLPEPMVPSAFVPLEGLPLSPNGKVDRRALPRPEPGAALPPGRGHEPPRTPAEEIVAAAWGAVLGLERVGIHDDFFELGGHSLLATQVISRIRKNLSVELPLKTLFSSPTIAGIQGEVDLLKDSPPLIPPIVATERPERIPLSF